MNWTGFYVPAFQAVSKGFFHTFGDVQAKSLGTTALGILPSSDGAQGLTEVEVAGAAGWGWGLTPRTVTGQVFPWGQTCPQGRGAALNSSDPTGQTETSSLQICSSSKTRYTTGKEAVFSMVTLPRNSSPCSSLPNQTPKLYLRNQLS